MTDAELIEWACRHFRPKPPDPSEVTPWAFEKCQLLQCTAEQLYAFLLSDGAGYREAQRLVYPPTVDQEFQAKDDLRGYVEFRRNECNWPLEKIAVFARGLFGKGARQYITRLISDEARQKHNAYRREYRQKNLEKVRAQDLARYYKNRERINKRRKELRDAKKNK